MTELRQRMMGIDWIGGNRREGHRLRGHRFWRQPNWLRSRMLMLWACLIAIGFIAMTGAVLWDARQDIRHEAETSAANLVSVMAREIERNVQTFDLALRAVDTALHAPGLDQLSPALRQYALFDGAGAARFQGAILAFDATGRVIADSRIETPNQATYTGLKVTTRDYFTEPRDHPTEGLFIGRPFRSQLTGKYSVSLSRRLTTSDGRFGGVVVGSLDLAFFQSAANQLKLGRQASVSLLRTDGVLFLREPFDEAEIGADWSKRALFSHFPAERVGTFQTGARPGSPAEEGGRLITYAQVGDLPMVIGVALSVTDIFATWNQRAWLIGGIVLALIVAMLVTVHFMQRELANRRAAEQLARESGARFRELTESSRDTILRLKLDGTLRYVSPSIEEMLGYRPAELSGTAGHTLIDPRDRTVVERAMGRLRAGADHVTATYRCKRLDGEEVWIESLFRLIRHPQTNAPYEAIASCRDVTARIKAEAELARTASTDGLTGLANRRRFDEVLALEWRRSLRENTFLALMMIDADSFKAFNDHYGHQEGDAALRMIARCIGLAIRRPGDVGARYGGEEFAVVMPNTDEAGALTIAERLRHAVAAVGIPHTASSSGRVTVSIGVAACLVFADGPPEDLLRAADQALYRAKEQGRNRCVGASEMNGEIAELTLPKLLLEHPLIDQHSDAELP